MIDLTQRINRRLTSSQNRVPHLHEPSPQTPVKNTQFHPTSLLQSWRASTGIQVASELLIGAIAAAFLIRWIDTLM